MITTYTQLWVTETTHVTPTDTLRPYSFRLVHPNGRPSNKVYTYFIECSQVTPTIEGVIHLITSDPNKRGLRLLPDYAAPVIKDGITYKILRPIACRTSGKSYVLAPYTTPEEKECYQALEARYQLTYCGNRRQDLDVFLTALTKG